MQQKGRGNTRQAPWTDDLNFGLGQGVGNPDWFWCAQLKV